MHFWILFGLFILIENLRKIYYGARLVDPVSNRVIKVAPDGSHQEEHGACYTMWGRTSRCENCISHKACESGNNQEKYEIHNDEVFHTTASDVSDLMKGAGFTDFDEETEPKAGEKIDPEFIKASLTHDDSEEVFKTFTADYHYLFRVNLRTGEVKVYRADGERSAWIVAKAASHTIDELRKEYCEAIIDAVSSAYTTVFVVDLDDDSVVPYLVHPTIKDALGSSNMSEIGFSKLMSILINKYVYEDDRDSIRAIADAHFLKNALTESPGPLLFRFRYPTPAGLIYYQISVDKLIEETEQHRIVVGISNKHNEILAEMQSEASADNERFADERIEFWIDEIKKNGIYAFDSPSSDAYKQTLSYQTDGPDTITSIIVAGVKINGKLIAFIGADNPKRNLYNYFPIKTLVAFTYGELNKKRSAAFEEEAHKTGELERLFKERTAELAERNFTLQKVYDEVIDYIGEIVEARDVDSGQHVRRIKRYVKVLAEEFEIMKTHTILGYNLINTAPVNWNSDYTEVAKTVARWHHEKYDGGGYPDGLVGDRIPIYAQIVSVADCYDALTSQRPYKDACDSDTAAKMILGGECGAFSGRMIAAFIRCMDKFAEINDLSK